MPIGQSAKKSLRKSRKNNKANVALKSKVKSGTKVFLEKPTMESLKKVYSLLDKAVKNHIFHINKAARLKSRYSKKVVTKVNVVSEKKVEKKTVAKKSTKKMS